MSRACRAAMLRMLFCGRCSKANKDAVRCEGVQWHGWYPRSCALAAGCMVLNPKPRYMCLTLVLAGCRCTCGTWVGGRARSYMGELPHERIFQVRTSFPG